jgi:hypothetical protein
VGEGRLGWWCKQRRRCCWLQRRRRGGWQIQVSEEEEGRWRSSASTWRALDAGGPLPQPHGCVQRPVVAMVGVASSMVVGGEAATWVGFVVSEWGWRWTVPSVAERGHPHEAGREPAVVVV